MNKYSRFLSFAAILVCLTPLGGVYTMLQTFPWMNGHSSDHPSHIIHTESSFQVVDASADDGTCEALSHLLIDHSSHPNDNFSFQDVIRYDAGSCLDTAIDTSYRTGDNVTSSPTTAPSRNQPQEQSLLHQQQEPHELDPLMFHVRNHELYNDFGHARSNNHVLLLSWTLSLLLGLLIPVLALLYDAYLKLTSQSRHQKQLQAIQKALKPYKRKVLTKSQAKESCPICLLQFAMGESILNCHDCGGCSQGYHQSCMVQWLLQQTKQQPNPIVETILSNPPAMSTLRQRKPKLKAPCPCCRQPFVTVPLVR